MNTKKNERRRFFRITDSIGVTYKLLSENYSEKVNDTEIKVKDAISIHEVLSSFSNDINDAVVELKHQNSTVAKAISSLNKKLDTVLSLLELDGLAENKSMEASIQEASISACGIAFPVDEKLEDSAMLELTLYLEASSDNVKATGRVIDCEAIKGNESYYVRVEFVDMLEKEREKLIQHIVQRQGMLLRSLKEDFE